MTRTANARIAGFTFLFYIAIGLAGMALDRRATMGEGAADRLANLAAQALLQFVLVYRKVAHGARLSRSGRKVAHFTRKAASAPAPRMAADC